MHGTSGGAPDWTEVGDAAKTTRELGLIVVMPDIALNYDGGGWCTNWPNGEYEWETFHIGQLVPWADRNLRTIRSRRGRAIAGSLPGRLLLDELRRPPSRPLQLDLLLLRRPGHRVEAGDDRGLDR